MTIQTDNRGYFKEKSRHNNIGHRELHYNNW